jgi:LuxR family quorum sensing-dependent transcriptional regulator
MEDDLSVWTASLSDAEDVSACASAFRNILSHFGFSVFASGEVDLRDRNRSTLVVVEWPEAWRKFYLEDFVHRDPLVNALRTRARPFTWSELREDDQFALSDREALKFVASQGWEEGLVVPIPRGGERFGIVSLVRARGTLVEPDRTVLILLAVYFHERAKALGGARSSFVTHPSAIPRRIIDCLRLAADGRSDKSIAAALNIKPWTAHEYMEIAKRRLGARTRTQAVAFAVSLGLIGV